MVNPLLIYYKDNGTIVATSPTFLQNFNNLKCLTTSDSRLQHGILSSRESYHIQNNKILRKQQPINKRRVAMIAPYNINCGIATYTKYICDEMKHLVSDIRIFAECAQEIDSDIDRSNNVVRCWKRGKDYSKIVSAISNYNPDVIFIQHEYGNFPNATEWNCLMSQLSRWRVIPILHTVLEHDVYKKAARDDFKTRCLWEGVSEELIVHQKRARKTLRDRGYSGKVHYIPHGCFPPNPDNKLPSHKYNMFSQHSIFQYGFGSKHKGWEIGIDVVDKLRDKYPDIIYIGMFNISDYAREEQTRYFYQLLEEVKSRGLENYVAFHKGYQSEEMLANFIKCSRVAFFPYQAPNDYWASWGASGAIRLPLSLNVPLVLSDFSQFKEFEGILPTCKDTNEFIEVIDRIFSDKSYENQLKMLSRKICKERSWDKVAQWYLECSAERDFDSL